MKCSKRVLGALAAVALASGALLSQAQAAALRVDLTPATDVAFGGPVRADIYVSGLTQAVGAYAFDLTFDATRMTFGSFVADPDTKMGDTLNPALDLSLGASALSVNFDVLAGFIDPADEAVLAGIQGAGFRLGTAEFTALPNLGDASFGLSGASLSNYDGTGTIGITSATGAQLCVSPNGVAGSCRTTQVPEPTTALLVAIALGGLAASRKRQLAA